MKIIFFFTPGGIKLYGEYLSTGRRSDFRVEPFLGAYSRNSSLAWKWFLFRFINFKFSWISILCVRIVLVFSKKNIWIIIYNLNYNFSLKVIFVVPGTIATICDTVAYDWVNQCLCQHVALVIWENNMLNYVPQKEDLHGQSNLMSHLSIQDPGKSHPLKLYLQECY